MQINQISQYSQVNPKYKNLPKEVVKFAQSMEEEFVNMMFEKMEKTSLSRPKGPGADYYESLLRRKRSEMAAGQSIKSLGIKELIMDQFLSKYPSLQPEGSKITSYQKVQNERN